MEQELAQQGYASALVSLEGARLEAQRQKSYVTPIVRPGVPQSGEEDQVKIIGTLCRKIIHKEFIHQLQQGDTDQVLALLNQTLSS